MDEINDVPQEIASSLFPTLKNFYQSGQLWSNNYKKIIFVISVGSELLKLIEEQYPIKSICKLFDLHDFSYQQVLELANNFNCQEFPPQRANKIAEYVYKWCSGHPYLTQDLYSLIEESTDCKSCSDERIPGVIERLVHERLISVNNANVTHLLNYLTNSTQFVRDAIFKILDNQPLKKSIQHRDLVALGILKFSEDRHLVIRNKIYEEVLRSFFLQF